GLRVEGCKGSTALAKEDEPSGSGKCSRAAAARQRILPELRACAEVDPLNRALPESAAAATAEESLPNLGNARVLAHGRTAILDAREIHLRRGIIGRGSPLHRADPAGLH